MSKKPSTAVAKVAKKVTKPHKFPSAADRSEAKPAVLCPSERVLKLYEQGTGKEAKKISKSVREWFTDQALSKGWDGVGFLPEAQSQNGAGCVLVKKPGHKEEVVVILKELGSDVEE